MPKYLPVFNDFCLLLGFMFYRGFTLAGGLVYFLRPLIFRYESVLVCLIHPYLLSLHPQCTGRCLSCVCYSYIRSVPAVFLLYTCT